MTLRQGLTQIGENPLPLRVSRNSPTSVSMRSPCREDKLFLLLCLKPPVRSPRNLERRRSLSLYNYLFPFIFFLSPFSISYGSPLIVFSKEENSSPFHYMPHALSLIFLPFSLFLYSLSLRFCLYPKTKNEIFLLVLSIRFLNLSFCIFVPKLLSICTSTYTNSYFGM